MTYFYTADLHLGHANIIEYCDRPFATVTEMNDELRRRWNRKVHPEDTVFVLGDYALGHIGATLNMTKGLTGHKVLIAGNHDRCFPGMRRPGNQLDHAGWAKEYLLAGFDEVIWQPGLYPEVTDDVLGWVQLSHFPYVGDSHEGDRYVEYRPPFEEDGPPLLLHGHVHTSWKYRADPHPMVNVGVDMWDFEPVSGVEIEAFLDAQ